MRCVLDTNVYISGIFWKGNYCSEILAAWIGRKYELVTSKEIIEEIKHTISNFKITLPQEEKSFWVGLIESHSILTMPLIKLNVVIDDPTDNKFLEAALMANADYVITQDKHLLKIDSFQNIKIITPKDFLMILKLN